MKLKHIGLLVVLVFIGSILAQSTRAQAPNYDVTVSPVFLDLSGNPGDTISDKIRIRNNTTSDLPIKIEVKALGGDEQGELTIKEKASDDSLSWIKLNTTTVVLPPLEWTNVPFTIEVPTTAAYGYYFAISFTQDDTSPLARTGAKITGAAAVPILLNVRKEGAKAEAKIVEFTTKSYINEYLPIEFNARVENTGNIHIRPVGNVFIGSGNEKNLAILDVNQTGANIIPETKRNFATSWTDGFIVVEPVVEDGVVKTDSNGKVIEKLTINWNKLTSFRIGKYTANLLLVYDNGIRDVPMEASLSFWVIPYKVIIGMIITLIIAFFVARFLIRRYIQREIRKRLRQR